MISRIIKIKKQFLILTYGFIHVGRMSLIDKKVAIVKNM